MLNGSIDDIMGLIRQPFCSLGERTASWIKCGEPGIPGFGNVVKGIVNEEQQLALKQAGCAYLQSFKDMFNCD